MSFSFLLVQLLYFVAAFSFIYGLKRMSSPQTARHGIVVSGLAMLAATLVTFIHPDVLGADSWLNLVLIIVAIAFGSVIAWWSGRVVKMTDMPQMIALYNGMGGGAAATIAAAELIHALEEHSLDAITLTLALLGAVIGTISFSGSAIAFAKLQGLIHKSFAFPGQRLVTLALLLAVITSGVMFFFDQNNATALLVFFVVSFVLGISMTMPIGGADMPVVISLYNALTGLAVAFEGFVLQNPAMIIAGTVVGAAGSLLTQLMAKAMNRPISNVLFPQPASSGGDSEEEGEMKEASYNDAASLMAYASQVIIVPGYGMAVAQAQHKIAELTTLLGRHNINIKFAIHPVAGRMPGHMNVLLTEAGIDYGQIFDLEEINQDFTNADVALVIGANDVVNPKAKTDKTSPIYGMPILDVVHAKNVLVIKRGKGRGFSGIENSLFFQDNTRMVYGDGAKAIADIIANVKTMLD